MLFSADSYRRSLPPGACDGKTDVHLELEWLRTQLELCQDKNHGTIGDQERELRDLRERAKSQQATITKLHDQIGRQAIMNDRMRYWIRRSLGRPVRKQRMASDAGEKP